jgi:hypothetical protein
VTDAAIFEQARQLSNQLYSSPENVKRQRMWSKNQKLSFTEQAGTAQRNLTAHVR